MSIQTIATKGAHLFQFNAATAKNLYLDCESGVESWWVNIDRNTDAMELEGLVFVWVSGPSDKAGIIGFGVASGEFDERDHPASYNNPQGPRRQRLSTEIFWAWVGQDPVVTRADIKTLDLFADFDLFKMPNRQNAFAVNGAQASFIIDRLKAVMEG